MANLIPQIAQILGVELGEKFKVESRGGYKYICNFTVEGLFVHDPFLQDSSTGIYDNELLAHIVCGDVKVTKLPWNPKESDIFYTFGFTYGKCGVELCVKLDMWAEAYRYYALLDKGWVYRTRAEAEVALPVVATKLGVDYEI